MSQNDTITYQETPEVEKGISSPNYLLGFPDWSKIISRDPENLTLIFRRFSDSAARNLLYLEGRVAALRDAQAKLDSDDYKIARTGSEVKTELDKGENVVDRDFDPFWSCYVQAAISWESYAASPLPAMRKELDLKQAAADLGVPAWLLRDWTYCRDEVLLDYFVGNPKFYASLVVRRRELDGERALRIFKEFIANAGGKWKIEKNTRNPATPPEATEISTTPESEADTPEKAGWGWEIEKNRRNPATPPKTTEMGTAPESKADAPEVPVQATVSWKVMWSPQSFWVRVKWYVGDRSIQNRLEESSRLWGKYMEEEQKWCEKVAHWDRPSEKDWKGRKRELREREQEREQRGDAISSLWTTLHGDASSKLPASLQNKFGYDKLAENLARRAELVACLKDAIREYQEALILHHKVLGLEAPAKRTRVAVKKAYQVYKPKKKTKKGWKAEFDSMGSMSGIFDEEKDLLTLHLRAEEDRVSRWLARREWIGKLLRLVFWDVKPKPYDRLVHEPEKRINAIVIIISMLAAIGFLIAAIWALWAIKDFVKKLVALTGFVVAFSLWVGLLTKATKMEVFAATATYAAVLVVYVGKG